MIRVYAALAGIIAFGVVYNFARISLSEQGREMASLRVLGFTKGEVSALLLGELAVVVLVAQPLGWLIGYVFAWIMAEGFRTELYRVPLVVNRDVYAWASSWYSRRRPSRASWCGADRQAGHDRSSEDEGMTCCGG